MKISREQSKLLTELIGQIKDELGIGIGYSHPFIGHHVRQDDQFIIFETPDADGDNINFLYCDDIEFQYKGPLVYSRVAQYPEHDHKVEELLEKINLAILEGRIWFDPGCIRKIDGYEFNIVTHNDVFKIEVLNPRGETAAFVMGYKDLKKAAKHAEFLKPAIKIIDEFWPRPTLRSRLISGVKSIFQWFKGLFRRG